MPTKAVTRLTKTTITNAKPGTTVWDTTLAGFGVRVLESGTRSYIFQYRSIGGRSTKITIGRFPAMSVDDARQAALDHYAHVRKGGDPSIDRKAVRQAATMADLAETYCGRYAESAQLAKRTIKDARLLLDRFMIPAIGGYRPEQVSTQDIRSIHSKAREIAGPYQANRLRAVMSKLFSLAIEDDQPIKNPCRGVKRFPEDQRRKHLSGPQVTRLLEACDQLDDQNAANAIRLLLFCGGRVQETLKAEWSHIDLELGIWTRPSQHTKTKTTTTVRLAREVVEILQQMKKAATGPYVFPGRDGDKPRADLNRPWSTVRKISELDGYRLHDLRRTHASFILSAGFDLATVGRQLGHTQAKTTQRYAFLHDARHTDGVQSAVTAMIHKAA